MYTVCTMAMIAMIAIALPMPSGKEILVISITTRMFYSQEWKLHTIRRRRKYARGLTDIMISATNHSYTVKLANNFNTVTNLAIARSYVYAFTASWKKTGKTKMTYALSLTERSKQAEN